MTLTKMEVFMLLVSALAGTLTQAQFRSQPSPSFGYRSCTLYRTSLRGTCQSIYECPVVLRNVKKLTPTFCYMQGRVPYVCCPTLTAPAALTDVSPPNVNFACGNSSVKPATRSHVEAFVAKSLAVPAVRSSFPEVAIPILEEEPPLFDTAGLVFAIISNPNTWPWMALLGTKAKLDPNWFCDGVLINEQWVLTAAHCVIEKFAEIVRLGEHDLRFSLESPHQDYGVLDTVFHPSYIYPQGYHDLALLKLDRVVNFNSAINPICLPWGRQPTPSTGSLLSLTGWGKTAFGGSRSNELREATVYILDHQKCENGFSSLIDYLHKYPRGITSDLLCIGDTDGEGQDACQGDSGGPVMYLKDDRYILTGVVSVGYGCGNPDFPGLYASIHHNPDLAWIKQVAF